MLDIEKPDVVIGTESWLSPDIKDNEVFPSDYTPYMADRLSTTKQSGGVFVLVKNALVCTEQPQFKTECELISIELDIVGTQSLYIAAFYKPKEDDLDSLEKLKDSLDMLVEKKGTIMVLGDFNLPKLSWIDYEPSLRQDCVHRPVYECF